MCCGTLFHMPIFLQWLLPIQCYKHGSFKCSKVFAAPPCLSFTHVLNDWTCVKIFVVCPGILKVFNVRILHTRISWFAVCKLPPLFIILLKVSKSSFIGEFKFLCVQDKFWHLEVMVCHREACSLSLSLSLFLLTLSLSL